MTRKEMEKAFPIGSKVKTPRYKCITVTGYGYCNWPGDYLLAETDPKAALVAVDPDKCELVHGPAVQEPHDGMIYNPFTKTWSWF